ncbi:hypothetical protein HKX54_02400 [Sulfitobacter sp. M57]|uniref:hypothetical protein n=1 Tax=unclassified Sulfitobacter TaxID=196795 RepID=UPI0023E16850|nr:MULTISPECIES: hypothetical protein [unclassified Sulfitobacter]MDF3413294.1 hypothetical protein [Sulfitobacter sp. KE5]MDF3421426.1 hypothetical protein [Sulfitobacter sp. KE43]MDF3431841.1 hypothetical protein [Sulfitobacter sp. KE42]MDF3457481.1 hypothetical protein [Sulfitobacter sp. S74]MDF3461383.1 hypothetical protein [Sulfitobacter sp. Ks18]
MTKSANLIETIRQEIIAAAKQLTAPKELTKWAGERGILYIHVSAATGASLDGCRAKFQWHRSSTTEAQIAAMSIPLTPENFRGRSAEWETEAPTRYIMRRMAEALDTAPDPAPQKGLVEMCYEDILQRDSDVGGFQHYQERLDAGGEGNSTLDLVRDIYLSPEAVALREQGPAK